MKSFLKALILLLSTAQQMSYSAPTSFGVIPLNGRWIPVVSLPGIQGQLAAERAQFQFEQKLKQEEQAFIASMQARNAPVDMDSVKRYEDLQRAIFYRDLAKREQALADADLAKITAANMAVDPTLNGGINNNNGTSSDDHHEHPHHHHHDEEHEKGESVASEQFEEAPSAMRPRMAE